MIREDPEYYFRQFRMTPEKFNELLNLVAPMIAKLDTVREAISPAEPLYMTLAFLVSGDQQKSVSKDYRLGRSTVCGIIRETTKVIFEVLRPIYLKPHTPDDFRKIAHDFEKMWQFPNCLGALDGKHFRIPAPPNSGSRCYNYKGFFSLVILAACDANHNFTIFNAGASGSEIDGGIFRRSEIGKRMLQKTLKIPEPTTLSHTSTESPFCFIGDEAFPLLENLMRPYPGDNLELRKRIFNYRLSRARRIIENTFGILVARCRVLIDTIHMQPQNAFAVISACIVLHNFARSKQQTKWLYCPLGFVDVEDASTGEVMQGSWRSIAGTIVNLRRQGSNNYPRVAAAVRETFADYFSSPEGSVSWQKEKIIDY